MKNQTAVFNAKNKTLFFMFRGESFVIDLTEGDIHDSLNGITLNNGEVFDFNFSWQEECEPSANLYSTYTQDGELYTNHSDDYSLIITEQIGTYEDYFGYKEGTVDEETKSFTVNYEGEIVVEASSQHEANQKVTFMEVDFNDTFVKQLI